MNKKGVKDILFGLLLLVVIIAVLLIVLVAWKTGIFNIFKSDVNLLARIFT